MSQPEANEVPRRHPLFSGKVVWSGMLSLIMPGLGQIHARSWRFGVTLLALTTVADLALRCLTRLRPEPALAVVYFAVATGMVLFAFWAAVDAMWRMRRPNQTSESRWYRSTWVAFLAKLAVTGGLVVVLPFCWRNFSIPAGSMSPTVLVGDYVVVDTRPDRAAPELGDIVVFKLPRDPSIDYIKRLVALPGARVQMKQGQLYINGQACPREPIGSYETNDSGYVQREKRFRETLPNGVRYEILKLADGTEASRQPGFDPARQFDANNTIEYVVPAGHFFAMGDHRDNSLDSRFINAVGFVPIANLVGRAEFLYFSIDAEHPWYEVWWWPSKIRWSRVLQRVQ